MVRGWWGDCHVGIAIPAVLVVEPAKRANFRKNPQYLNTVRIMPHLLVL